MTYEINEEFPVIEELYEKAGVLSYYNAAEGASWYNERIARESAYAQFRAALWNARRSGLKFDLRGYLL